MDEERLKIVPSANRIDAAILRCMQKHCKVCQQAFIVSDDDLILLKKLSPVVGEETHELPVPDLCFLCRLQRRLAFYNSRSLYRRTCDHSGASIVSIFSPDKPFTVYEKEYWFTDQWDPLSYGRPIDFEKPFFPQITDLVRAVPLQSIAVVGGDNMNSDYTNDNYKLKNCYLIFDGEQAEDCYYGHSFVIVRNCMDFVTSSSVSSATNACTA